MHFGVSYLLRIALCLFEECMLKENKRLFRRKIYILTPKVEFFIFEIIQIKRNCIKSREFSDPVYLALIWNRSLFSQI